MEDVFLPFGVDSCGLGDFRLADMAGNLFFVFHCFSFLRILSSKLGLFFIFKLEKKPVLIVRIFWFQLDQSEFSF